MLRIHFPSPFEICKIDRERNGRGCILAFDSLTLEFKNHNERNQLARGLARYFSLGSVFVTQSQSTHLTRLGTFTLFKSEASATFVRTIHDYTMNLHICVWILLFYDCERFGRFALRPAHK